MSAKKSTTLKCPAVDFQANDISIFEFSLKPINRQGQRELQLTSRVVSTRVSQEFVTTMVVTDHLLFLLAAVTQKEEEIAQLLCDDPPQLTSRENKRAEELLTRITFGVIGMATPLRAKAGPLENCRTLLHALHGCLTGNNADRIARDLLRVVKSVRSDRLIERYTVLDEHVTGLLRATGHKI